MPAEWISCNDPGQAVHIILVSVIQAVKKGRGMSKEVNGMSCNAWALCPGPWNYTLLARGPNK